VAGFGTVVGGDSGGAVVAGAGATVVDVGATSLIVGLSAVVLAGVPGVVLVGEPGVEPTVEVVVGDPAGATAVGDVVDVGARPDVVTGRGR
jgi:hypothetical protein